jgi:hypothetical protein
MTLNSLQNYEKRCSPVASRMDELEQEPKIADPQQTIPTENRSI